MEEQVTSYLLPLGVIVLGVAVGLIGDRLVVGRVRSAAAERGWRGGEVTAEALSGMGTVLGALTGTWIAVEMVEMVPRAEGIAVRLLTVAAIIAVTIVATRMAAGLTRIYTSREDTPLPASTIFVNIVRIVVLAIGILIGLSAIGVSITPLLTALGVGGLAVALALQDTLSNLFSGLQLIGSRQINPGEYIALESGEEGYVEDITWRFTTVRQLSNNLVVIPNAKLASSRIVNFNAPIAEMSVVIEVGVAYDSDLEHVERVTIETAAEVLDRVEGPIEGFEPFVRFHTFADSAIQMSVILRVNEFVNQFLLKHEFVKALKARYDAEGIEIPFPQRSVTISNESA